MTFTPLPQLLEKFEPYDELETLQRDMMQQYLAIAPNPYDRKNLLVHTVADAWIVNVDRTHTLLLVPNAYAQQQLWLAPGGHTDGDPDMLAAALREAEEETGLKRENLKQIGSLFDLNIGAIPTRQKSWGLEPEHLHFDICFAFEADMNLPLAISEESTELRWVPLPEALDTVHPQHRRRVEKTMKGLLNA